VSFVTYAQAIEDARKLTDAELNEAAQGCTELTCMYHGPVNEVRRERGIR
jgi:hypothetical protein